MVQAGQSPYNNASSAQASALLRSQVKQTVQEAADSNEQSSLPSSSPTTAAIAIQPPAGTSQQAFQSLVAADAASLGSSSSQRADIKPGNQASDELQRAQTAFESADDAAVFGNADASESISAGSESDGFVVDRTMPTSSQLPSNLSMLHFAKQSEAERYQKKAKLESFDKIIGRPPNTPHHVSLQAAPTQKAYLPQWLASPLGMQASQRSSSTAAGLGTKPGGTDSLPASRFTTEDTELHYTPPQRNIHRDMSLRISPPRQHQRQLHQADPNDALTPGQSLRRGNSVHSGPNPFSTLSQSAFSPDHHKPPRPLSRAASDTTICNSNSIATLSPALPKVRSSSDLEPEEAEGSFVSLQLQTVRPTAPKPYQTGHFGRYTPPGELHCRCLVHHRFLSLSTSCSGCMPCTLQGVCLYMSWNISKNSCKCCRQRQCQAWLRHAKGKVSGYSPQQLFFLRGTKPRSAFTPHALPLLCWGAGCTDPQTLK